MGLAKKILEDQKEDQKYLKSELKRVQKSFEKVHKTFDKAEEELDAILGSLRDVLGNYPDKSTEEYKKLRNLYDSFKGNMYFVFKQPLRRYSLKRDFKEKVENVLGIKL